MTPLSWDKSRTWLSESAGRDALTSRTDEVGGSDHDGKTRSGDQRFRFVQSGRGRSKRRRLQQSTRDVSPSRAPVDSLQEHLTPKARDSDPIDEIKQISPANTTQLENYGMLDLRAVLYNGTLLMTIGPYLLDNIDFAVDQDVLSTLSVPEMTGVPNMENPMLYPENDLSVPQTENQLISDQQDMTSDPSSVEGWVISVPEFPAPSAGIGNQHDSLFKMCKP